MQLLPIIQYNCCTKQTLYTIIAYKIRRDSEKGEAGMSQPIGKKNKNTKALSKILRTGGIDEVSFQNIYPNILQTNYEVIRIILLVALGLFCFLLTVAIISSGIREYLPVYIALLILLVMAYIAIITMHEQYPNIVTLCWYFCASLIYGYAIYMGTFLDPDMLGTVFCVLLIALPMLIIDRPYKIILIISVASIIFVICSFLAKTRAIAMTDTINVISFYFLSIFINIRMIVIRIRELDQRLFIEHQRDTDHLTGLMQKTAFTEHVKQRISQPHGLGFLIIIDLDNFKRVNDLYGHEIGDDVIKQSANCIRECFGEDTAVGRFGGDEFLVYIDGLESTANIDLTIQKLLSRIPMDTILPDRTDLIRCSAGISSTSDEESDYSDLFRKADTALYYSKRNGRNRSYHYTESMQLIENRNE